MRTVVYIMLAGIALAPASAENWVEIDRGAHNVVSVDKDSGEHATTHVKFWLKTSFDAEHPIGIYGGKPMSGENLLGMTKFVEMRGQIDVDCTTKIYSNTYQKFFDRSGLMVSDAAGGVREATAGPNSIVGAAAAIMCPLQ